MKRTIKNPALVGYTFNVGHPHMQGADSWTIVNENGEQEQISLLDSDIELTITPKFKPGYFRKTREADGTKPIGPQSVGWFSQQPHCVQWQRWERVEVTPIGD